MRRGLFVVICVMGYLFAEGCTVHVNTRDPVRNLEDGMPPPIVRGVVGVPDTIYGPLINAYNDTVEVWSYIHRVYRDPYWVYMVNQRFFKYGEPRMWSEERGAISSTHFRK